MYCCFSWRSQIWGPCKRVLRWGPQADLLEDLKMKHLYCTELGHWEDLKWCDARAPSKRAFTKWRWWSSFTRAIREIILPALNADGWRSCQGRLNHPGYVRGSNNPLALQRVCPCGEQGLILPEPFFTNLPGYNHTRLIEICQQNANMNLHIGKLLYVLLINSFTWQNNATL